MTLAREHLREDLTNDAMAERAGMSPRNFARTFKQETGITPAKAIEKLRVELAKASIAQSTRTFTQIAEDAGFGSAERMRHAFLRILGLPPQALRRTLG
jgi:transcriptional regulator GlxA family with amidase domain